MKRMILVLTVSVIMLVTMVAGGFSAVAQDESPGAPQCGWYYSTGAGYDPWWEYWCWWPGWGWEFVFWVYD